MSDYVKACAVADVPDEGAVRVIVGGVPLAVVRSDGEVYAIFDVCSHQDVPLSEGDVEEGTIECWLHGSRFDLSTGRPTSLPATRPVPVYPVKIDGDDVLVALQES
ncbi:non-heme iron oxygenase ferredoxin subunit [Acidothermaceae bacterium B102]|nr:non-heme iron oxygenase ferredoxin subunit [Acidothermaceae bacterium B102]